MNFTRTLARYFPVPRSLSPIGAGVDITDASIKWMTFRPKKESLRIAALGQQQLPPGIVEGGTVKDIHALSDALAGIKKQLGGTRVVHAALPEESAYVFSMRVPDGSSYQEILNMIEFELKDRVPIPIPDTVYDFDFIARHRDNNGTEIGVVAFPREIAEGYAESFDRAGLQLVSLEIEARSIARAVSDRSGQDPITLLVDAGKGRTGFAIMKRGVPIFTSTVDVGGGQMSKVVMENLAISEEEAQVFKNERGLVPTDKAQAKATEALEKIASTLADEVARHYHFWDTRRDEHGERVTPVERIYLVGGCANLKGLPDYIAGKVHAATERPDMWRNVMSFDDAIPPIDRRTSLQFGTAIGLALRSFMV